MPLLTTLPPALENVKDLLRRRGKAAQRRQQWESLYRDVFRYAMPSRDTFSQHMEGQNKQSHLYDSTLQETTYEAANTLVATLFPPWERWGELAPGADIPRSSADTKILAGLQTATEIFFGYLHSSNFSSVIHEVALDLMIGTGSLCFDEGAGKEHPFIFSSVPISAIEIEEGPNGIIETTFQCKKVEARHLERLYPGLKPSDLPSTVAAKILEEPEFQVEVVQVEAYDPATAEYYGVVVLPQEQSIVWRYGYGDTCPMIVARATKLCGEAYGRGRALRALADTRTLDKMVDFTLRNGALAVAPPMTGVSDGVLNPYTARLQPNTILPVASNDSSNPSLRMLDMGGNFNITQEMIRDLRERIRRVMMGPEMSQGPIKTATEITIADRNRLWAMNGEFSRVQAELLAKVVARGVDILKRKGLLPPIKVDGREVAIRYTSPFARSQDNEDVMALQMTTATLAPYGPNVVNLGLKTEELPEWVARKTGLDMKLVRSEAERMAAMQQTVQAAQQMTGGDPAAMAEMAAGG